MQNLKKHYLFAFSIGIILLLLTNVPVTHAESGQTYEVYGSSVNVRTDPAHDADIVGTLNDGDQIDVFQESFGWYQTYYAGQTAWVASQFVAPAANTSKVSNSGDDNGAKQYVSSSETITIQADGTRVRSGPGTENPISGYATKNETYTLLESTGSWYKIAYNNGKTGWVASWLTNQPIKQNASNETSDKQHVASKTTSNGSLSGYTVVLDPGHGGKDPGSIALDGSFEDKYTLNTANRVKRKLQNAGADVIQTRTDNTFISLADRVTSSEENNADVFISLHYNAYPKAAINGFSSHYYAASDKSLSQKVQSGLTRNITLNSRGIMKSDYHVLRENSNPSILLELGFITNTHDLANIQTPDYQDAVGEGIAEGLLDYF